MNTLLLIGKVKQHPIFKQTNEGVNIAYTVIETNKKIKNKGDENENFNVIFWNQTAEYLKDNIKKDDYVMIRARLKPNNYKKEDKEIIYRTEIIGEKISNLN